MQERETVEDTTAGRSWAPKLTAAPGWLLLAIAILIGLSSIVRHYFLPPGTPRPIEITQDEHEVVRPGMTAAEVRRLLGRPLIGAVQIENHGRFYHPQTGKRAADRFTQSFRGAELASEKLADSFEFPGPKGWALESRTRTGTATWRYSDPKSEDPLDDLCVKFNERDVVVEVLRSRRAP
jgi:hypothetical protein